MDKYVLGEDVNVVLCTDEYPERVLYCDNAPIQCIGTGIAIQLLIEGSKPSTELIMDKKQAKALIKGLKKQIKLLK